MTIALFNVNFNSFMQSIIVIYTSIISMAVTVCILSSNCASKCQKTRITLHLENIHISSNLFTQSMGNIEQALLGTVNCEVATCLQKVHKCSGKVSCIAVGSMLNGQKLFK